MARGRKHRPHKPHLLGPRLERRGRWWAGDFRPWGEGRLTLRDPSHPDWPKHGRRTELEEVAREWARKYVARIHDLERQRELATPSQKAARERAALRLDKTADAYLRHRSLTVAHRTFLTDQTAIRRLQDFAKPHAPVSGIDPQEFVHWLLLAGYRAGTVRTYMMSLRGFWAWLKLPAPDVAVPDPGEADTEAWTDEEIVLIRNSARKLGTDHLLAIDLALYVGLRQGEIFGAWWEDFRGTKTFRVQRQLPPGSTAFRPLKGKKAGTTVVLPGWRHKPGSGLIVQRAGKPIGDHDRREMIRAILDGAKLNNVGVGWHRGRHTFARMFLELKPEMELLRASLRHTSVTTTERYYRHWIEDRAAEIAVRAIHGA